MEININQHSEFIFGAVSDGNPDHALTRMGLNSFWGNSNSTGVRVRFSTNSRAVSVKLDIQYEEVEPFFGSMMINGATYIVKNRQQTVKMECISGRNKEVQSLYTQKGNDFLDYEIHCPAKNCLKHLFVYIDDDAEIQASEKLYAPICFLGGPTTFGRGSTFPHGMFSSIVARKFSCDYYNFAMYNNKYLEEKFVLAAVKAVPKPCFTVAEICSIPVAKDYITEKLEKYLEKLAECFNACPVLLLSQPFNGRKLDNYTECRRIVKDFANRHSGRNIMYLDGETVFKGISLDMATLSAYLINDYGNMVLADRIIKIAEAYTISNLKTF